MVDLNLLATEMKAVAKQNPHNQERVFLAPEVCHRVIELDGIGINVMLTFNEWDSMPLKTWQLTCSREDRNGLLADVQTKKIVVALLGTKDVVEFTSMMPPEAKPDIIRQFVCKIDV